MGKKNGWLCESNFNPSTAINQLETWQAGTFDAATINRELRWTEALGMNVMRVYLHHVACQVDKNGFKKRLNTYLNLAENMVSRRFLYILTTVGIPTMRLENSLVQNRGVGGITRAGCAIQVTCCSPIPQSSIH